MYEKNLKPCPLCENEDIQISNFRGQLVVDCPCGLVFAPDTTIKSKIIEEWNNRPNSKEDPKKPEFNSDEEECCPVCENNNILLYKYCPDCGQRINHNYEVMNEYFEAE